MAKKQDFSPRMIYVAQVVPTSFGVGAVVGLLWLWPVGPIVKRKMEAKRASRVAAEEANASLSSTPAAPPHPASSIRSIGSIGTSIGSHHQRRGSHVAEYDPEVGAIKFNVSESVKSLKLIIDSEVDQDQDSTEHATNIDEPNKQKKKNFLVRFEEATYKQNLEKQCFDERKTTEEIWANAATYDSDVEQLFTYVQVFTASLSSFAHGAVSKKLSFCCFLFIFHQLDVHKLTHTHYVPYRMILPTLSLP